MNRRLKTKGFSLTEVLLAAGILVIGFMLIAGTLPVGVKLTAMGTERTIGAVAADEAFAKVQLFGLRNPTQATPWPADPNVHCVDYAGVSRSPLMWNPNSAEYSYPSTDIRPDVKKYHWAAMCKYNMADYGLDTFQVTVFVSRDRGLNTKYPYSDYTGLPLLADVDYPRPVPVLVEPVDAAGNVIAVGWADRIHVLTAGFAGFITDESVLLDDRTGQIMRVLERDKIDPTFITLEDALFKVDPLQAPVPVLAPRHVWVIPPAKGSGRYPGVGVYQRTIKFR